MEKAYDLKVLGEMIRAEAKLEALSIAEEALESLGKAVYIATRKWFEESAKASENKIDDFIIPLLGHVDKIVIPMIEKIDLDGDGK